MPCKNDETFLHLEDVTAIDRNLLFVATQRGLRFCFHIGELLEYLKPLLDAKAPLLNPHTQVPFHTRTLRRLVERAHSLRRHGHLPRNARPGFNALISFLG